MFSIKIKIAGSFLSEVPELEAKTQSSTCPQTLPI